MVTALAWLSGSIFLLVALVVLFTIEDRAGGRIVFRRIRAAGDQLLQVGSERSGAVTHSGGINYLRLSWYFIVHSVLKRLLFMVRTLQAKLESSLQQNRAAARRLRTHEAHTHLDVIAAHKEKVALSSLEREKRMKH